MMRDFSNVNISELARKGAARKHAPVANALEHGERVVGRMGTEEDPDSVLIRRDQIHPHTKQPRHDVSGEKVAKRRKEMMEEGQIHSIKVEPMPERMGHYRIIDGELRWRASYPDSDWMGLEKLRCTIVTGKSAVEAFVHAAKANDQTEPLTDYDWALSVEYLFDTHKIPFTAIENKFDRPRNWANDHYHAVHPTRDENVWPKEVREQLLNKLKQPGNLYKVKAIAGAGVPAYKRNELIRDFDSHSVDSIKYEVKKWVEEHRKKSKVPQSDAPQQQEQSSTQPASSEGTGGHTEAPANNGISVSRSSAPAPVTLPTLHLSTAADEAETAASKLASGTGSYDFMLHGGVNLKRLEAAVRRLRTAYDDLKQRDRENT